MSLSFRPLHSSLDERCMCGEVLICWAIPSLSDSTLTLSSSDSVCVCVCVCVYICPGQINKVCFCMHRPHIPTETHNKVSTFGSDCAPCSPAGVPVRSLQISFRVDVFAYSMGRCGSAHPDPWRAEREERGPEKIYLTRNMQTNGFNRLISGHNVPTCNPNDCSQCIRWLSLPWEI